MAPAADPNSLIGTWKLVSMQFEFSDTGERVDMFGAAPNGRLAIAANGYMVAVITPGGRTRPKTDATYAALFRDLCCYSGRYQIEGDRFITRVDVAWHPAWEGSDQRRTFRLDGDTLILTTDHTDRPTYYPGRAGRGVLRWIRD